MQTIQDEGFNFYQPKATAYDCLILSICLFFWWVIQRIVFHYIKIPTQITKITHESEFLYEKYDYLNSYVTFVHNWMALILAGIYAYNNTLTNSQCNTPLESAITYVILFH